MKRSIIFNRILRIGILSISAFWFPLLGLYGGSPPCWVFKTPVNQCHKEKGFYIKASTGFFKTHEELPTNEQCQSLRDSFNEQYINHLSSFVLYRRIQTVIQGKKSYRQVDTKKIVSLYAMGTIFPDEIKIVDIYWRKREMGWELIALGKVELKIYQLRLEQEQLNRFDLNINRHSSTGKSDNTICD